MNAAVRAAPADPAGWVPFHVTRSTPQPLVLWSWLGATRFTAPFFDQTLAGAFHSPLQLLLQRTTTVAQLVALAETLPPVEPRGLIFHVSRCGSTLVAQMLARLESATVIAEAQPFTRVLEDPRLTPETRAPALRALARVYAHHANAGPAALFLKFDSRNLLDWAAVRAAFPESPAIVVHRDPVEVLVSNLGSVPAAMLPGEIDPARLGPPPRPIETAEDYTAFVLSRIYSAAAATARAPRTIAVEHRELPGAVVSRVAPHFGMAPSAAEREAMSAASRLYSKDPARQAVFVPDSAAKQSEADARLRALAETWLAEPYRELRATSAG